MLASRNLNAMTSRTLLTNMQLLRLLHLKHRGVLSSRHRTVGATTARRHPPIVGSTIVATRTGCVRPSIAASTSATTSARSTSSLITNQ